MNAKIVMDLLVCVQSLELVFHHRRHGRPRGQNHNILAYWAGVNEGVNNTPCVVTTHHPHLQVHATGTGTGYLQIL
jgi:hypothetical protein